MIAINVDQRLVKDQVVCIDPTDDVETVKEELAASAAPGTDLAGFYAVLNQIDGMDSDLMVERYRIILEKGSLFSWATLLPSIVAALQMFIAKDGTLEEVPLAVSLVTTDESKVDQGAEVVAEEQD
jgi:hypothetical protein